MRTLRDTQHTRDRWQQAENEIRIEHITSDFNIGFV